MPLIFSPHRFTEYVSKHDIALESLAADLNVRPEVLLAFADGTAHPSRDFLAQMCDEMGVDIYEFCDEEN